MLGFGALGQLALGELPRKKPRPSFTTFSAPSVVRRPTVQSFTGFVTTPVVVRTLPFVVFGQQSTKTFQQGFTGFIAPVVLTTPVFSQFSQPTRRTPQEGSISNAIQTTPVVVQPYVFSQFTQPTSKQLRQAEPTSTFFIQPAAVVTPVFTTFSVPVVNKPQTPSSLFVGDRGPAQTPPWFVFSSFDKPQTRLNQEGFITTTLTRVVQNQVFTRFDQPLAKRVLQQDQSFVNFPAVVAVVQPYVFSSYDQPLGKKSLLLDFGKTPAFIVPQSYVFSQFSQPSKKLILDQPAVQFTVYPQVAVQTFFPVFTDFEVPVVSRNRNFGNTGDISDVLFVPPVIIVPLVPIGFSEFIPVLSDRPMQIGFITPVVFLSPIVDEGGFAGKWIKSHERYDPKTTKVDSSNIAEVTFNKRSNELNVKFQNGAVYNYTNVDDKKVKGLLNAKSSGKYLHNNIKGKYFATRMK